MLIQDFELLAHEEKDEIILEEGIFLANFDEENDMCDVYELFDFYVAICYKLNQDLRPEITASVHADELPHLTKIHHIIS